MKPLLMKVQKLHSAGGFLLWLMFFLVAVAVVSFGVDLWRTTGQERVLVVGAYETDPAANREGGYVVLAGSTCFVEGVDEAVTRVGIRWSWLDEEPGDLLPFYNEDGGTTPYGPDRLPLDEDNCFTFSDFRQKFPPNMVTDLERHPEFGGQMEIVFTLSPRDMAHPETRGSDVFVFAGPFFIPPAEG